MRNPNQKYRWWSYFLPFCICNTEITAYKPQYQESFTAAFDTGLSLSIFMAVLWKYTGDPLGLFSFTE